MPIDYNSRVREEDTTIGTPSGIVSTSTAQSNPSMQGSGQFSNLQDYVRANEGAKNSTANRVGQDIGNRYNTALSGVRSSVGQIGEQKQALDTQRNQFNTVIGGAGTSSITPEQIANARNLAMGVSSPDMSARTQASNLSSQAEVQKQQKADELKNIGSGTYNIQDYLKGIRSNPSSSTRGELRLDEFLTRQTPEGATQLQNAATRGTALGANTELQTAMGGVNTSVANLSPTALTDYVRQNRGTYQAGLGDINRTRAESVARERRNISDVNASRAAYQNSLNNAIANDQTLAGYTGSVDEANALIRRYNDTLAQTDQFAGTRNFGELNRIVNEFGIAPDESAIGRNATAVRNDIFRGLQRLREQRGNEIQQYNQMIADRRNQLTSGVQATDPYSLYTQDVANASTRQNALRPDEMARLQALYSISGEDEAYRQYLAGGL
jgi:hypothetical protein